MEPTRLVKASLPAKLVAAMDDEIAREAGYADRQTFLADAIAGLLAELTEERGSRSSSAPPEPATSPTGVRRSTDRPLVLRSETPLDFAEEWTDELVRSGPPPLAVAGPDPDVPVLDPPVSPAEEPTWGMHNRDWPTLWAASDLGRVSRRGPAVFDDWLGRLADDAFEIAARFKGAEWDLSGLPANREKRDRSVGRFRSFFVGNQPGDPKGPLFTLGLAIPTDDPKAILLTAPGADLLRALDGLEPRKDTLMRADWRAAFLAHLAAWAPADFEFMASIVGWLLDGTSRRMELLEAVAAGDHGWSPKSVATNVAGFVARGREWNLIRPDQEDGRYVCVPDAAEALDVARASADELRARYV